MKISNNTKRKATIASLMALAIFAIFAPDSEESAVESLLPSRFLAAMGGSSNNAPKEERQLAYVPASGQCEVEVGYENFEGPDWAEGWTNGMLETENQRNFTKFLGRYGMGTPSPSKTYSIPATADTIMVEIDFYEVDSWDGDAETASIFIDDEQVDLGDYQWRSGDDQKVGTSPRGIQWTSTKLADPQHLGYHDKYLDQTHHISLVIPASSGLFSDGTITMSMVVDLKEPLSNESAGWDNINISYETKCTDPPSPAPADANIPQGRTASGVNGDPLVMGLKGQLFKFDGRSGAWYSAISTPSFQWNMKISQFEGCPITSDTFCSGAGFTFFDSEKRKMRTVEVNVVNEHNVDVGCGGEEKRNCLGAGSLEIMLDGTKMVVGGDYKFKDGSGRVLAFNTFYQCARKWYDFEEVDVPGSQKTSLREGRSLESQTNPGIFDVMEDLKDTMIDEAVCQTWINERQTLGDLFQQGGHYSTIIIQTESVTFHVEYKQENERCNAHSINVWVTSVSPSLWNEPWEGVIGETKEGVTEQKDVYSRTEVLKFADDEAYEVKAPFSTKCRGCVN